MRQFHLFRTGGIRPVLAAIVVPLALASSLPAGPLLGRSARAAEPTIEKVAYRGWANNLRIHNGDAELIVTLDVGPRIISYRLTNGVNVFKNYDAMMGGSGEDSWKIRGGHRLWIGPEDITRTYALDNGPVDHKVVGPGHVRLIQAPDTPYGVRKEIDLKLAPTGSKVTLTHRITNVGSAPTSLAPWALTVMAPGGIEVIPLPPKRNHPGDVKNARSPADFAPDQFYTVWPFTDFKDPRWDFNTKYIALSHDPNKGATKLGIAHRTGGVGYLNGGTLFIKRFGYQAGAEYPDHGVNFETFTNEDMLEMESLGPITRLAPGASVEHVEHWELIAHVGNATTPQEIVQKILPKLP